jgi:hypothetical protein
MRSSIKALRRVNDTEQDIARMSIHPPTRSKTSTALRSITGLVILSFTLPASLQAQIDFDWSRHGGGPSNDRGHAICTDAAGNVFITGVVEASAAFGPYALNVEAEDAFIVKYAPDGTELWAKRAGGPANQECGNALCTDDEGNVYVAGLIQDIAQFDDVELTSHGVQDIFIAKYDGSGALLWARNAGGILNEEVFGICVDGEHGLYITGSTAGVAYFGADSLVENTPNSGSDLLLAKYDLSGTFQWAKRCGGEDWDVGKAVGVDLDGNLFVTGYYTTAAYFDGFLLNPGDVGRRSFMTKFDVDGTVLWARTSVPAGTSEGTALAVDPSGDVVAIGMYFSGPIMFENEVLPVIGDKDIFLTRYDTDGTLLWARNAGGPSRDIPTGIAIDSWGSTHICGSYTGNAHFGVPELTSLDSTDVFVATYDAGGTGSNAISAGGISGVPLGYIETANGIAADNWGHVYTAGTFKATATFAPGTVTSSGAADVFVARPHSNFDGQAEQQAAASWSVYPDPTEGHVSIRLPARTADDARIELFDPAGRMVQHVAPYALMSNSVVELDLSARADGIYVLRLVLEGVAQYRTIAISR